MAASHCSGRGTAPCLQGPPRCGSLLVSHSTDAVSLSADVRSSGDVIALGRPGNSNTQAHTECFVNGVPQPAVIARLEHWVFDAVTRLRHHPAVGGYYGCDDCCHVNRGSFAGLEYAGIAAIKEEIFMNYDPYHPMFGTIACGELWMWQEEGYGLGLDVVMKEGYGGGAGGGKFTPEGTPANLRDFPMSFEPIWPVEI